MSRDIKILFVHTNFPAQYRLLAQRLAREPNLQLAAIGSATARPVDGVKLLRYSSFDPNATPTHPFARRFDLECRRAEQVLYTLTLLRSSGFTPDIILGHPGWGECLPLRTIFPNARYLLYCEFFYGVESRDVGFDPEFPTTGVDGQVGLNIKNAATLLALAECDRGISPTFWQKSTYPKSFQNLIEVIHEGIDVDLVKPSPNAVFPLDRSKSLKYGDEVVTFVARNLEPLRGYHIFMRALPRILAARPKAHVVIVGGDATSYGPAPPPGTTWREKFLSEVSDRIDQKRVHFTGPLSYQDYLTVLQVSAAHVYFTYPFVLSWSMIEAMSAGCIVIGSDTAPVREIIDGDNGILLPFFDAEQLADCIADVLANPGHFNRMRMKARETAIARFDFERITLPTMFRALAIPSAYPTAYIPRVIPQKADCIVERPRRVITFGQRKGGVGKTTLAVSVAAELWKRGADLCLVDADLQRSASQWAELGKLPFPVWEIGFDETLISYWVKSVNQINADIVLIDTAPNEQALWASASISSMVVVPCTPSGLDLEATERTMEIIGELRRQRSESLGIVLVPNRVDGRTPEGQQLPEELATFGEVVSPPVASEIEFLRAFSAGQPVFDIAPDGGADHDIRILCDVIEREFIGLL